VEDLVTQDNSTSINKEKKAEQPRRVKCPKGMKLPRAVKIRAALAGWKTQEQKNAYMRSMGIAIHEAAAKVKNAARTEANKSRNVAAAKGTDGLAAV
jgi:hypothetical protein